MRAYLVVEPGGEKNRRAFPSALSSRLSANFLRSFFSSFSSLSFNFLLSLYSLFLSLSLSWSHVTFHYYCFIISLVCLSRFTPLFFSLSSDSSLFPCYLFLSFPFHFCLPLTLTFFRIFLSFSLSPYFSLPVVFLVYSRFVFLSPFPFTSSLALIFLSICFLSLIFLALTVSLSSFVYLYFLSSIFLSFTISVSSAPASKGRPGHKGRFE